MKFFIVVWLLLQLLRPTVPETTDEKAATSVSSSVASTPTTTGTTRGLTSRIAQTTAPSLPTPDNCTRPVRVANQFDTPGLTGWDLTSHAEYFNNSASEHENSLICQWRIARHDGLITLIRITSLMLESSPTCSYDGLLFDFVELNTNFPASQNFCGSVENKVLLAVSDVNITFKTDSSVNYRGFHLQWAFVNASLAVDIQNISRSSLCTKPQELQTISIAGISAPGERLVSHENFIMNSVHRGQYRNNQNCRWTLTPKRKYILLWVRFVQLEYSGSVASAQLCSYDNLTVRFSNAITNQTFSSTMCALTRDRVFLASSSIEVTFRTDSSVGSRGFGIEWLHLNETQASLLRQSWSAFANTTESSCTTPESMSNLTLNSIGVFPGGQLVSHPEYLTIRSSNYQPNLNCNWTIRIPNNSTLLHFKVVSLDLETSSVRSSECRFDNLTVLYKDVLTDRWVSKVACRSLHLSYFTSKSDVVVKFVTDRSVTKRGFHLMWFLVPLQDAYRLQGLENMQSFDCPEFVPGGSSGELVYSSQRNINCQWQWTVNDGEIMNISASYENEADDISRLESHGPFGPCCLTTRKLLSVSFGRNVGHRVTHCLCNNRTNGFSVVAYPGPVTARIRNFVPLPGYRVRISYRKQEEPVHTNCSAPHIFSKYQSKIADRIQMLKKVDCEWTVQPLDENHGVQVKVTQLELFRASYSFDFFRPRSRRATDCSCTVVISTTKSFGKESLRNWTLSIESKQSSNQDSTGTTPVHLNRCCGRRGPSIINIGFILNEEVMSLAPVTIKLNFSRQPLMNLVYEINIQHFPIAKPGSSSLCSAQPSISKKHIVVDQRNGSRLVSLKQITVTSSADCMTSALLTSTQSMDDGHGIKVTVNCTESSGHINVVQDDLTVTSLNCHNGSILYSLVNRLPVTLDAVGTGGFTAVLELVSVALEQDQYCPMYSPSSNPWTTNLVLYSNLSLGFGGLNLRFCTITMSPRQGHELIVQLQMRYSNNYQEQFCSLIASLHYKPKLSFIISIPHREGKMKLSLCDHNTPGGLQLQDQVRVREGESLTIDLTVASRPIPLTGAAADTDDDSNQLIYGFGGLYPDETIDAFLLVNHVEVCERLPSSGEQWQVSPDGTQLLSTVAVAPDNTQTDCNLQLDAPTAAGIASHSKFVNSAASKLSNAGCWNLEVKLDEFSTVCGLKQLLMTVSHWDSLAKTVVHSQREICGSDSPVGFRIAARLQPAGSGMSLKYSGVRSGFRAQFSISACSQSPVLNEQLVDSPVTAVSVSPALIAALIILALCNVLAVLFVFRARIFHCAGRLVGQRSQQLIYRTGIDGVNLIDDDT